MTTQSATPAGSLNEQIRETLRQRRAQAPKEVLKVLQRASDQLAQSNLGSRFLKEGDLAPDFTLPNARTVSVRLGDLLRRGPVVVSFYRGAWCPYCNLELRALQAALPQIRSLGAALVAISPQTPDHSLSTAEKNALEFEVLSDVGNRVAREYGLVFTVPQELRPVYQTWGIDLPKHNGDTSFELPVPATYIVGADRIIRLAFADLDYTRRLEPATIIAALSA